MVRLDQCTCKNLFCVYGKDYGMKVLLKFNAYAEASPPDFFCMMNTHRIQKLIHRLVDAGVQVHTTFVPTSFASRKHVQNGSGDKDDQNGWVGIYNKEPASDKNRDWKMSFPKFQIIRDLYDNDKALATIVSHVLQALRSNAAPREMVALDQRTRNHFTYNNLFSVYGKDDYKDDYAMRVMMEFTAYGEVSWPDFFCMMNTNRIQKLIDRLVDAGVQVHTKFVPTSFASRKDVQNGWLWIYNKEPASDKHSDWNMSFPNFQITPDFYNNDAAIGTIVSRVLHMLQQ